MSRTTKRVAETARTLARKAGKAVVKVEQRVEKKLRQQRRRRVLRQVGETALAAGAAVLASGVARRAEGALQGRRLAKPPTTPALGMQVRMPVDPERAIARLTDGLAAEGFGIVTRTDLHATFRDKLGIEFRPYVILGACNPGLARRAIESHPEAGLLLPCTITVEAETQGGTVLRIADPGALLAGTGLGVVPALAEAASEARERLLRVADGLQQHARTIAF